MHNLLAYPEIPSVGVCPTEHSSTHMNAYLEDVYCRRKPAEESELYHSCATSCQITTSNTIRAQKYLLNERINKWD